MKIKDKLVKTEQEAEHFYAKLKDSFHHFLTNLNEEKDETKQAFELLRQSVLQDKELTKEEKHQIGEQLKDVFKTIGLVGIAILPGGSLFFILSKFLKLNKYILPSSFEDKVKIEEKKEIT